MIWAIFGVGLDVLFFWTEFQMEPLITLVIKMLFHLIQRQTQTSLGQDYITRSYVLSSVNRSKNYLLAYVKYCIFD